MTNIDKHSNLLLYRINFKSKTFYSIGPKGPIHNIFYVTFLCNQLDYLFLGPGTLFQVSLIFKSNTEVYLSEVALLGRLLAFPQKALD